MFIFDDLINEINNLNSKFKGQRLSIDLKQKFNENSNQIIFNDDKAYELGASPFYGVTLDLLTDEEFEDEILLFGDDLNNIKNNTDYARIVIGSINKDLLGEGNELYNNIRRFDYVKYHLAYEGIMVRESVINKKESLVISKKHLKKDQLNFSKFGSYIINKQKGLPFVKNVKVIFINQKDYDYKKLTEMVIKCENITKALDHLMNKVKMDCHSCSLQVICNEVEKKVKEDFNKE